MNETQITATVVPFLIAFGYFLKNHTPLRNDWIPSVLVVIGLVAVMGITRDFGSMTTWILAFGAGFAAVGVHSGSRSTKAAVNEAMENSTPTPGAE